jgi:hypothetical protein
LHIDYEPFSNTIQPTLATVKGHHLAKKHNFVGAASSRDKPLQSRLEANATKN